MGSNRVVAFCALLAPVTCALGCSRDETHAPYIGVSCGTACISGNQNGGGVPRDGGVGSDSGSDGGVASITFQGTVGYLTDVFLTQKTTYTGAGNVTVYGIPPVTGSFSDGTYALQATVPAGLVWALAEAAKASADAGTSSSIQLLPTLELLDRATTEGMSLELVPVSIVNEIYGQLNVPTSVDVTRAQIFLRFVTAAGTLVSGASIGAPSGVTVAYDTNAGFSDIATATGAFGTAVLVNADAVASPGSDVPITYTVSGKPGTVSVRAARGAATLMLVTVSP